jgi:succinate dehydrogenase / fumarate reductase cytochrome b subunit
MKVAWWTGCVAKGGAPELYQSMKAVGEKIGLELEELVDAACTGAGVLSERNPELADTLCARTFAMAEKMGLPLMNICSTCQGVMSAANYRIQNDPEYRAKINANLASEGLSYEGNADPKHFMWLLVEDFGLDKLAPMIQKPLEGLNFAPFYGCYILRPTWVLGTDHNPHREHYLEDIIELLKGNPVDYLGKTRCCGFPILTMNRKNSLKMVATHTGDALNNGADAMVTPCPLCHLNLESGQPDAKNMRDDGNKNEIPILHLSQLIGMAMGLDPKSLGMNRHFISTKNIQAKVRA